MTNRSGARVAAIGFLPLTPAGCSAAQDCTDAGADNTVGVTIAPGAISGSGTATLRVCAGAVCTYRTPRLPFPSIAVGMASLTAEAFRLADSLEFGTVC